VNGNSTLVFLVKLLAPLAVIGAIAGVGLYVWDMQEDRAWREVDVKFQRKLNRDRRELRRLERDDELSERLRGDV
jgi:hypothetical protein